MATITRYVNPDSTAGGDGTTNATTGANRAYVSLSAWDAAEQQNLDTGNNIAECVCETNGTADAVECTIDGWTTSSTDYIDIKTSAGHRHAGVWSTAKYRLETTTHALIVREDYVRVTGLQLGGTAGGAFPNGIGVNVGAGAVAASIYLTKCLIRVDGSAAKGIAFNTNSGQIQRVWNNIIYDCAGFGIDYQLLTAIGYLYNNTVQGCGTGIDGNSTNIIAKNNVVQDCTTCYAGTFATGTAYNCSDDGTQPGTNGQNGEVTFADEAGNDFHLSSSDTVAKDNGTDLSADSILPFSDDLDGDTRSGSWDIGADEVVAAGNTVTPDVGAIVIAGLAPTITATANHFREPGVGTVVISGLAPTVTTTGAVVVEPGVGAVVLTGAAPTIDVTAHHFATPGVGAIVIDGLAPSILVGISVAPAAGAIVIEGHAPTVTYTDHMEVFPGAGSIVLTGHLPTLTQTGLDTGILQGGSGYPATIYWQGKRRKKRLSDQPNLQLRKLLDTVVAEYYGDLVESDVPQSVKEQAAKIVKPFVQRAAKLQAVPPVEKVNWKALQRNASQVRELLNLWKREILAREIDAEDEYLMLVD